VLQRAYFDRATPTLGKPVGSPVEVMFNPTDFTLTKGSQLAEIAVPGLDSPLQQYIRGQAEKLTVKLFFDTTDEGTGVFATSVTEATDRFYNLVKIDSDLHAPPVCIFGWGRSFPGIDLPSGENQKRTCFTGVVESVQQEFTLFSDRGIPLRATLTVAMREYRPLDDQQIQIDPHSRDHTRAHVVQRGETLSLIAGRMYGNPAEWRPIADRNGISNPKDLRPGTTLEIPPLERGAGVPLRAA
jgi:nucleoid-associated protein YgaU